MSSLSKYAPLAATALFVLLWSSGGIFTKLGLEHASAYAFLSIRFAIALAVIIVIGWNRPRLKDYETCKKITLTGLLLIGGYSLCYFLSLDNGITPGVLAAILGLQPILTLFVMERFSSPRRIAGLIIALTGLIVIVFGSILKSHFSLTGIGFSLAALFCMTVGAIQQKKIQEHPLDVIPLQYGASLILCLLFIPFKPFEVEWSIDFMIPLLWMAIVISVIAQLLFYKLIRAGNLVNVTSLFYLVPVGTVILDYLILGNALSLQNLAGMTAILLGLLLVFRQKA